MEQLQVPSCKLQAQATRTACSLRLAAQCLFALLLWVFAVTAQADLKFPALTGRVVDSAQMLEPSVRTQLDAQLKAHEQASGEQLVVVTLPDLQGATIEDFGYQLGRHWGIGQKDKNNGALLIVARDDRKLRIEVGYGLEDRLTDAQSSVIINQVITPAFKTGNFNKGISDGVAAMLVVLGGSPLDEPAPVYSADGQDEGDFIERHPGLFIFLAMLFILTIFVCQVLGILPSGGGSGGGSRSSGGGFGGGGGGGFSGGGGSFGGGGSSGGW
ncbi:TPM domain-containing protein [Pseudomonas sp. SWRI102]|uniref:TPM domain-containing protein n=1 Tax=Pseudomonas marvdashtae TaxID=2745500 RepID=A0A923FT25_9PSED|nr:TPM domain-containing protein [Pseudomonas marvdashtae]